MLIKGKILPTGDIKLLSLSRCLRSESHETLDETIYRCLGLNVNIERVEEIVSYS